MKAQIGYRNNEGHITLGEAAPLAMPYVLVLDPSSLCNLQCVFCPSGDRELIRSSGRAHGVFDFSLFQKVIADLSEFDEPLKVLRLYKEGEPLINPRFADMVREAKSSGFVKRVDTTTNGILLNPELNRRMIDAGIDQINISVNGLTDKQYETYTRTRVDCNTFVKNIRDLCANSGSCEIYVKGIYENMSEDDRRRFLEIFGEFADRVFLEHLIPNWPTFHVPYSFDGLQYGNHGNEARKRSVCPFIFYMMVVNSDGRVSTCIQDWPNKQIVGDLRKQSVKEIWNSPKFDEYRIAHLSERRNTFDLCEACEVTTFGTQDDLDDYASDILERMAIQ